MLIKVKWKYSENTVRCHTSYQTNVGNTLVDKY